MVQQKKVATYILRLTVFAATCVVLGVVVLILCFAPATNPSFLSSVLYRGSNARDLREMTQLAEMLCGPDAPSVKIYNSLSKPQPDREFKDLGLEKPEMVKFKTSDGVELNGWYFRGAGPDTGLVCYNGFGKRLPLLAGYIKMLREVGMSALLFDYRGLNNKDIKVSPHTACIDGQAAYDYLVNVKKVAPEHLVLLGRDMGSHVCLKIAAAHKCKALILENPWATVKGFVEAVPGALAMRLVPGWLYTEDCLNNVHLVSHVHPPIMVITDDPDVSDSGNFFAAISAPKSMVYVEEYMPQMLCPDLTVSGPKYLENLKNIVSGQPIVAEATASVNWLDDYSKAQAQAKKANKPLLAEFGALWCPACRKMDRRTYTDPDVAARLNNDFVPVKMDLTSKDAKDLESKYPFSTIPMVLVLDQQGNLKKTLSGYMSPNQFLKELVDIK